MSLVDDAPTSEPLVEEEEEREGRSFTRELWFLGVVAVVLALTLKTFFIQAFFIPSGSMEQTLHGCPDCIGDRVLVNKVVYRFRDIHRGEIVVFNGKGTDFVNENPVPPPANFAQRILRGFQSLVGGAAGEKDFIKRVIGVPGDIVACCTDGKVTINGQPIDEPYVYLSGSTKQMEFHGAPETAKFGKRLTEPVPEGHIFVMGDHRDGSSDSRYHGYVPIENVVGRAFAVFYPVYPEFRPKVLRVPETFSQHALGAPQPARRESPVALPDVLGLVVLPLAPRLRRSTGLVTT